MNRHANPLNTQAAQGTAEVVLVPCGRSGRHDKSADVRLCLHLFPVLNATRKIELKSLFEDVGFNGRFNFVR